MHLIPTSSAKIYSRQECTTSYFFGFFSGRRWPGHNHFHFECNIFKCISLSKNYCCVIIFSQKCVPEGVIDNKSPLFKVTVWHWNGDKPLPEQMLMHYSDTLVHQPGSLSSMLHIYIKCISCYPANLCLIMYLACYNIFESTTDTDIVNTNVCIALNIYLLKELEFSVAWYNHAHIHGFGIRQIQFVLALPYTEKDRSSGRLLQRPQWRPCQSSWLPLLFLCVCQLQDFGRSR